MPHEYDDPVTREALEAAVALTIDLRARRGPAPLSELAAEAVDVVFCTCVTGAADAATHGHAPTHVGLIAEVERQARTRIAAAPH